MSGAVGMDHPGPVPAGITIEVVRDPGGSLDVRCPGPRRDRRPGRCNRLLGRVRDPGGEITIRCGGCHAFVRVTGARVTTTSG